MTCSAYVYVISSHQMEDIIDTDSLRAIVMRDPNVFEERRILIAVTRLDQYNTTSEEESDSDSDSDDESSPSNDDGEIPKRIESIKEVIQRQSKCLGVPIPDDCIIPLCATRALKARKKIIKVTSKKPIQESKLSTANERDKISQVPLLEEKLNKVTAKSQYLWYYSIVRDCTRYCDQAMAKLDETKKEFMKTAEEFNDKVKEKESNLDDFGTLVRNFRFKYEKGSEFSQQLQVTYNEDLETNHDNIDRISNSHLSIFESFRSKIKERKPKITTAQFNSGLSYM
ncbi:PREDICTED: uncharacterized protein LOC109591772 [Amphimedon queenslandica]|uniref:Uncharacterized protein n=1 Tax=Amphimedon queenslandica TaxID=400682 RepID=A0AAN0K1E5_AMPQE|nr:PREDICTED: uncharacterized protein LOC109591772 [Amphimedon queenslandica]|eukprot:XP_019862984.1 PREDICTED: uncharacterized protein LOC109591772 [Amphimedon queenslandica]